MRNIQFVSFIFSISIVFQCYSQRYEINYDESKINPYNLPSVLTTQGGMVVKNVGEWEKFRKPEILNIFVEQIFGKVPDEIDHIEVIVQESNENVLGGAAKRKQVTLLIEKNKKKLDLNLLIYLPKNVEKVPVFLGYNFYGNHTISDDPNVEITKKWVPIRPNVSLNSHFADEQSRGKSKTWPIASIIKAGYGLITLYSGDIDPDKDDFTDGIHPLFYKTGQDKPTSDEWGTIAAWSWGLSRVMDYIEKDHEIDHQKVIVIGHSRLGKAALWTAATDSRIAACISNNSGAMGAALSRRKYGETVEVINTAFPHWFCGNFKKYSKNEHMLPVDQHMLLALIAPRPLYVASATEDRWADPKGEFLSVKEASPVYNLYGVSGFASTSMPVPDRPIIGEVSYHLRTGKHGITDYDWEQYIEFAEKIINKHSEN